jgi:virulence factor
MIEYLTQLIKYKKKQDYLNTQPKKQYAFVGLGSHSISNLYPIINYFRLNLKYIVTKSEKTAKHINNSPNYSHTIGTTNYDLVLRDEEICGIFICSHPKSHFELVQKALLANKNVFVEKPPCLTVNQLESLIKIENKTNARCYVGLQKQYAPTNLDLKKRLKTQATYNYRYVTGNYPEGDPIFDLFIHPICLIFFLFGSVKSQSILTHKTEHSISFFIQFQHNNKSKGTIEVSTNYSWQNPKESLIVNDQNGVYEITNAENLLFIPKSKTIIGLPQEKVLKIKNKQTILQSRNNFIPTLHNNQLFSSGYFSEMKVFIDYCETGKNINNATLHSCLSPFKVLSKLQEEI